MLMIAWSRATFLRSTWSILTLSLVWASVLWATTVQSMTPETLRSLKRDTRHLFDHGYTNYMAHAFPEDELKPISCRPQTRNRKDPSDIGLNDVLGNYSVTLVDSLSTLAILASDEDEKVGNKSLGEFQAGIKALVGLYGDGTEEGKCGSRACGFDLDSKVQVFETNIRGVGGLLSAHLFAIGELPIRGYKPSPESTENGSISIDWNGFTYNGQLLRLAFDLASRLLPAFGTETGLPYPRVNLRTGIPFYRDADGGVCRADGSSTGHREVTETCTAGAGSLVLEFSTLSRLTGDDRFEKLAKRAFWAVWERRSAIGLLGNGIDAESGQWTNPPLTGIGAGIDSFFEYSMKSHILLSGLPYDPLKHETDSPESFLNAWAQAHSAVKHHIYRSASSERHAFYSQADLTSGAPRYNWVDNLSAYYPGLLVLSGELEEAIESHLLYAALWTRYSALPERWHVFNSFIDPNFRHWAGRPEFIESTYYLYQATKDPWYLHVGEMALRDIRRRCWTKCGWADLGDVVSGEQRDRMESFFLGETAKYLYLLFMADHPLNTMDAPVVFSTEGHPLVIPAYLRRKSASSAMREHERKTHVYEGEKCPAPPKPLPLSVSNAANRADLFHAAALAQLHLVPVTPTQPSSLQEASANSPGLSLADIESPTNRTFYPWTMPRDLIPPMGVCAAIKSASLSTLTFPDLDTMADIGGNMGNNLFPLGTLHKVANGVRLSSLSNVRLNMVEEPKSVIHQTPEGNMVEVDIGDEYRIQGISNWALGRDEKVIVDEEVLKRVSPTDPHFTLIKDAEMIDLILDIPFMEDFGKKPTLEDLTSASMKGDDGILDGIWNELEDMFTSMLPGYGDTSGTEKTIGDPVALAKSIAQRASSRITSSLKSSSTASPKQIRRQAIPAILPTGPGAIPMDNLPGSSQSPNPANLPLGHLPYTSIFFLDDQLCENRLPARVAKSYNILVIPRGGCSFNEKLSNIPSFPPSSAGLQLVVVMSLPDSTWRSRSKTDDEEQKFQELGLIRPLLDDIQRTPSGLERRHGLKMCMVDGTDEVVAAFKLAASGVGAFDTDGELVDEEDTRDARIGKGLGIKRRFWFESLGKVIGNLILI